MKSLLRICLPFALLSAAAAGKEVQGLVFPIKVVSVASPVLQEVVESVEVEEGATVKQGDMLVQLRNSKEKLAVEEAERLVENAEFQAKGAEALFKEKMGSKEVMLKHKTELELAKIRLQAAKVALEEKSIKSPISGIVVKKYKEPGESVDRVEKLVDVVNIEQVFVQFYLEPALMQTLKEGQEVSVRFPDLNANIAGKIDFIDPRIDAASNTFRLKVLIENADQRIKAGMRGTADFSKLTAAR
jgi:membrane fusion protein, multidrug efflux system